MNDSKHWVQTLVVSVLLLIVGVALMITVFPFFKGIAINRETLEDGTKILIYGQYPLSLLKGIGIGVLSISILLIILNFLKEILSDKHQKTISLLSLLGMGLILIYFVSMLILFPLNVDDVNMDAYNYHAWSVSLAGSILSLSMFSLWLFSFIAKTQQGINLNIQLISEGSICVALAIVLSVLSDLIPGLKMPNGGSFSLSMLPLFIFALRRGIVPGALVGFTYGIANFLIDGFIIHWGSIFFDYFIPFTLLGAIGGVFMKKATEGIIGYSVVAVLVGSFVRYVFHGLSGMIFFADYTPDGMSAFYYSFIFYNLPYMVVSTVGALLFVVLLHKRLITLDTRIV